MSTDYPYNSYSSHTVLGMLYKQNDTKINEREVFGIDELKMIHSVIENFIFFVQPKWKIANDIPGSGNTRNIGGITNIEKLIIRNTFKNNISNLHFLINNTRLLYSDSDHSLYNNENKPLYFNDVYIEYQSIVKETDGSFTMLVKLSSVNGRILDEIIPIKRFLLSSDLNN